MKEILKKLSKAIKIDINSVTEDKKKLNTLQAISAKKGISKAIKILIKRGINLNYQGPNGYTAFMSLCLKSLWYDVIETEDLNTLIINNADINLQNSKGNTTLIQSILLAKKWNKIEMLNKLVDYLMKNNVKVNIENKKGLTALSYAIKYEMVSIVSKLVNYKGINFKKGNCEELFKKSSNEDIKKIYNEYIKN